MRMWMVNPKAMCTKHLLGEHVELHMFVGTIRRGVRLDGYVKNGLVETASIQKRHDALVAEMKRRGMNHKSELKYKDELGLGNVNVNNSARALVSRCEECANRIDLYDMDVAAGEVR